MTDQRFRSVIALVLRGGVLVSGLLISAGFIGSLFVGWRGSLFGAARSAQDITDFGGLMANILDGRPIAIGQVGLIVLVGTPVVRVIASLVGYLLEGDRAYAAITAFVLLVLLASLLVVR